MSLRLLSAASKCISEAPFIGMLGPLTNCQQVRYKRTKHWVPKFKLLRRLKVIKVDLPKFNENWNDLSEEEMRAKMKERGILPPRPWIEKPMHIGATGGIFEAYVPPEGDGKVSPISAQGAKQSLQFLEKKTKTMMAIRKIRTFEEDWDTKEFCKKAQDIYIKVHELMAANDIESLPDYVSERAYPEVIYNMKAKTIRWRFLKEIELPRVVHARCTHMVSQENVFAQITVRFHTQQSLAIYDRFGRLIHGSEILGKDVLEYVVFEKHLANEYGTWRIHDKIIPDWMPPKPAIDKTFKRLSIAADESAKELEAGDDSKTASVERAEPPKELTA